MHEQQLESLPSPIDVRSQTSIQAAAPHPSVKPATVLSAGDPSPEIRNSKKGQVGGWVRRVVAVEVWVDG